MRAGPNSLFVNDHMITKNSSLSINRARVFVNDHKITKKIPLAAHHSHIALMITRSLKRDLAVRNGLFYR